MGQSVTKNSILGTLVVLALLLSWQAKAYGHAINKKVVYPVSLLALVVNPDKYDGNVVRVTGVFGFYFSESTLYASMEWFKHGIASDAIILRLDVKGSEINKLASWTGKYVYVQGVFDARDRGPMGDYSGAIKDVSYLHLMNEPVVGDSGNSQKYVQR